MNPFDPMPAIKSILGMPIYEAVKESHAIAHLDDFEAPQCEDSRHDIEHNHHSGAAKYLFLTPCSCPVRNFYVCADFVNWILSLDETECSDCGLYFARSDLTFIPLGAVK